MISKHFTCRKR